MDVSYQSVYPTSTENCPFCHESFSEESDVIAHNDGGENHPIHKICLKASVIVNGESCPSCRKTIDVVSVFNFFERMAYEPPSEMNGTHHFSEIPFFLGSKFVWGVVSEVVFCLLGLQFTTKLSKDIYTVIDLMGRTRGFCNTGIDSADRIFNIFIAYYGTVSYGIGCYLVQETNHIDFYKRIMITQAFLVVAYSVKYAVSPWISQRIMRAVVEE